MRAWLFGLVALCACALAMDAPAQQGETRIALIIANESYVSPNLGRLPGTQRDAALMRDALSRAGFNVTVLTNLSRQQMRDGLSAFERRLSAAGPSGVGFFYYSGHGVADRRRGRNYLMPVDAQVAGLTDLPTWGLPLDEELDAIENAAAKATFIVIDACRNTPLALNRSSDRGLVATPASTRTLIAFSTQPGDIAADDNVYARNLAQALTTPGADAVNVFQTVLSAVARETGEHQVPRFDSGLIDRIIFVAPALAVTPLQVAPHLPTTPPDAPPNRPASSQPVITNVSGTEWTVEIQQASGERGTLRVTFLTDGRARFGNVGEEYDTRIDWTWRQTGSTIRITEGSHTTYEGTLLNGAITGRVTYFTGQHAGFRMTRD